MEMCVCVDISMPVFLFSLFRPRRSADATSALTPDSVLCAQLYRVSAALSRCARSQAPSEPARILDAALLHGGFWQQRLRKERDDALDLLVPDGEQEGRGSAVALGACSQ